MVSTANALQEQNNNYIYFLCQNVNKQNEIKNNEMTGLTFYGKSCFLKI